MSIYLIGNFGEADEEGYNSDFVIHGYTTNLETATKIANSMGKMLEDYNKWFEDQGKYGQEKAGQIPPSPYVYSGKYVKPSPEVLAAYSEAMKEWQKTYREAMNEFEANNPQPEELTFFEKPTVKLVEEMKWS